MFSQAFEQKTPAPQGPMTEIEFAALLVLALLVLPGLALLPLLAAARLAEAAVEELLLAAHHHPRRRSPALGHFASCPLRSPLSAPLRSARQLLVSLQAALYACCHCLAAAAAARLLLLLSLPDCCCRGWGDDTLRLRIWCSHQQGAPPPFSLILTQY